MLARTEDRGIVPESNLHQQAHHVVRRRGSRRGERQRIFRARANTLPETDLNGGKADRELDEIIALARPTFDVHLGRMLDDWTETRVVRQHVVD